MEKDLVGDWGADVSDGDYACAVAALGVLESSGTHQHQPSSDPEAILAALRKEMMDGERTPVWRGARRPGSDQWRRTIHTDAAALAAAWRMYLDPAAAWRQRNRYIPLHERGRPRLALRSSWRAYSEPVDLEKLSRWLRHPDVQLNALVIDDERDRGRAEWHWPLRVGVLEGAEHAAILDALLGVHSRGDWVGLLSQCFTVGRGRDACDLLVVSSAGANRLAERMHVRIRASIVVVLEDVPPLTSSANARYGVIRSCVDAGAAAAVDLTAGPPSNIAAWFREVIRQISHDVPIHAALTLATRSGQASDPLIVGAPRVMDACRLLFIADRHDRIDAALAAQTRRRSGPPASPAGAEPTFGGPGTVESVGPPPLPPTMSPPSTTFLADMIRTQFFTSEVVDGVRMVHEFARREETQSAWRRPRWVQASAWRKGAERPARALDPERWNLLTVYIGPSDEPLANAPFPDERVDFTRGDVEVIVQIELTGAAISSPLDNVARELELVSPASLAAAALSGPISQLEAPSFEDNEVLVGLASTTALLPTVGDSTLAAFALYPSASADQVEGRVSLIHKNRVLQTTHLSIGVAADESAGKGLTLVTNALIHPCDDDLSERREYDVAIQTNNIGGTLHLTVQQNGAPVSVQLDSLATPIKKISDAIKQAAQAWDYSKSLAAQSNFADPLYLLAASGSELEQHLRKKCGNAIDSWGRIQLVTETNTFFPIEYVYDGRPPDVNAAFCPNATGALDSGTCTRAVGAPNAMQPCPNRASADFLCPLHFWGFRRLIERNAALAAPSPTPTSSMPKALTVPSKRPYGPVNGLLFAVSNRAFQYLSKPDERASERAALVKAFNVFAAITPAEAMDWAQWRAAAKKKPNLLVLVPHCDQFRNAPALEIGDQQWLGRQQIDGDLSGAQGEPQILLLLGCSAASVTDDFQPYPERFRDAGVSIVLAPVSPIRGADAVPIAKRLTELLADTLKGREPSAFGELLPMLRRQLLRDGHPGVMSIVGFGDGDWLLGGA